MLLDTANRRVFVGDVDAGLSPLEFAVVQVLVRHFDVPMSKEAIGASLPVQVDPRMIDVYVSRARAKLAACGMEDAVATVWGRGYRIGASPSEGGGEPAEPPHSIDRSSLLTPA